jgi:heptose I phosphotransferase
MAELYVGDELRAAGVGCADSAALLQWARSRAQEAQAEDVYRSKEGRQTLRFNFAGHSYFLKLHSGIGWGEVVKNLLQLRLPVTGASNEYRAVQALSEAGVDTMTVAAYACEGVSPASRQSMIVTADLVGTVSLEDYCADWAENPPASAIRFKLVRQLALTARCMHGAGVNHRDFYLCHFHLDPESLTQESPRCHVIDLHRAQLRRQVPRRWQVKDLAGLLFSAMDCGLTQRDLLRFLHYYSAGGLRRALGPDVTLWRDVLLRARKQYRKQHGREPPLVPGAIS